MSSQRSLPNRERSTSRAGMGRLVDLSVDDLVERQAEPLARRMVDSADASPGPEDDKALLALQEILFGTDRDQIQDLAAEVESLRHQISDKEALAAAVAPVLGDAIRRQIQESREEIIDALYPVIGQIVMRAVTEAIRDLARSIDERLQAATDFQRVSRRLRSFLTGIPVGELALRESLPLLVQEIYLIHRESGLLLWHTTRAEKPSPDSDLIGGMLTAIQEFAGQVLGGGGGAHLHQLQVGTQELILEFGRHSYVALLIDGVAPTGFRWKLYQQIFAFEKSAQQHLRQYDGDASRLREAARRQFEPFLSIEAEVSR